MLHSEWTVSIDTVSNTDNDCLKKKNQQWRSQEKKTNNNDSHSLFFLGEKIYTNLGECNQIVIKPKSKRKTRVNLGSRDYINESNGVLWHDSPQGTYGTPKLFFILELKCKIKFLLWKLLEKIAQVLLKCFPWATKGGNLARVVKNSNDILTLQDLLKKKKIFLSHRYIS